MMNRSLFLACVLSLGLMVAAPAYALLIEPDGSVSDWSLTPFTLPNQANTFDGVTYNTVADGYAPIAYPTTAYQPSPGLANGGEVFDLEQLHARFSPAGQMQVLAVLSSGLTGSLLGETYHLGDLFIQLDQLQLAVVTQSASQGLPAGAIYRIDGPDDTVGLEPGTYSWASAASLLANDYGPDDTVANIAGPFAVASSIDPAQQVGTAAIQQAFHDYGGPEDNTFLIEYNLDLPALGITTVDNFDLHLTWGCGNDVIQLSGSPQFDVPEPASMALFGLGGLLMLGRPHRDKHTLPTPRPSRR